MTLQVKPDSNKKGTHVKAQATEEALMIGTTESIVTTTGTVVSSSIEMTLSTRMSNGMMAAMGTIAKDPNNADEVFINECAINLDVFVEEEAAAEDQLFFTEINIDSDNNSSDEEGGARASTNTDEIVMKSFVNKDI
jgi:hypothetical protein